MITKLVEAALKNCAAVLIFVAVLIVAGLPVVKALKEKYREHIIEGGREQG
ncbi:hypothetical protein [Paraburkholderia kirstenboschensis]|uniref:Uncharacterized protein n=1 Tax=Paraburkholderia kirstenboschensis TaxID=1245436 RepID=A0ABZ0E8L0_9BURK|nr:hypothetical protein [Paraburkholderia kirstenboschensis]WOD13573.1 hypothetical protein RW095_06110 [Paraburkholderia kirstenboschensis]